MGISLAKQTKRDGVQKPRRTNVRTTLVVTDVLNRNVEIYCALNGLSKNSGMVQLISEQLAAKGFKPDQYPKEVYYS